MKGMSRRPAMAAIATLSALVLGSLALEGSREPAEAGCGAWRTAAVPASPGPDRFLFGVSAASPSDAWAVGSSRAAGRPARTLALHWDGSAWQAVRTPNAEGGDNFLNAVAADSSSDAWAAGFRRGPDGVARTLVMHWDGRRWSILPSPNPGDGEHVLSSASAARGDDVWLAGYSRERSTFRPLILHWDGVDLRATYPASSGAGDGSGSLSAAVGAISAAGGTALAVGGYAPRDGGPEPLVLRWDGSAWRWDDGALASEHGTILAGVAASPSGAAWVVGGYPGLGTSAGFAAAFDGEDWTTFDRRTLGTGDSLSGVAAFAGGAWAVGSYVEDRVERTLIERGDASGWRRVPSPDIPGRDNHLLDIAALPSGEAWAVGSTTDASRRERPLIQHFCPAREGR
jgi:hypothetical protein